ncbi:MAG: PmoA family protein [Saprospiraceae bacterium]|nr:PmoA family protein [Saprospiraceae bacterium]
MQLIVKSFLVLSLVIYHTLLAFSQVEAIQRGSVIEVRINGKYFTTYISSMEEKYPFFFPVNGPSGASVTSMRNGTYPHHSSLFFGCDKVNGGNYWQEGIERGQILAIQTHVRETGKDKVVIEQENIWHRPDAKAPIKDFRTITISAPEEGIYQMDFVIDLEMLMDVSIERTNHSLFSVRVDPDLAVINGGDMTNAEGDLSEAGTFGKASAWMDISGARGNDAEGIAIMQHPDNPWYPAPWFTRDYGFFSPTPMYWPENQEEGTRLKKGDQIKLKYRVLIHSGDHLQAKIGERFQAYSAK